MKWDCEINKLCTILILQRWAEVKVLTGRKERKVKSEKKWVLRMELIINHTVETALAAVRNPQKTAKGCCERYNTNDDEVGRWCSCKKQYNPSGFDKPG